VSRKPVATAPDNETDAIRAHSFETQRRLAEARNYNEWIFSLIRRYVTGNVLDVGCSTGNVTEHVVRDGRVRAVVGLDLSPEAVAFLSERFKGESRFRAVRGDVLTGDLSGLAEAPFDSVVCVNVLEHLEDDRGALRALARALKPGGHVALFCPALEILYGTMDRLDGHVRRYSRGRIERTLAESGFEPVMSRYVNVVGTFGWFVNGRVLRREVIPYKQMLAFDRVVPVLRRLERIAPPPFGQSVVAIGRKPVREA
jgi:SAM-dependent methyltransferase